jgi:ion channel POLLUX/CASTOR
VLGEQHRRESVEDADTKVILLLLLLRTMRTQVEHGAHPFPQQQQIVTEILDSSNKELAESTGAIQDVIISNDLVSNMIAQICRDKRTEPVLTDFFDETGKEIYMKPAGWYAAEGSDIVFGQLQRAAFELGEIAIGLGEFRNDAMTVKLNPGRSRRLLVHAGLSVIVISEHEGKETRTSEDTHAL